MDDPELEQFVLEKSSPLSSQLLARQHSSGSSSPVEIMKASSPQTPAPCSHTICPQISTGVLSSVQPASLTSSPKVCCSPVDSLPSISQFSSNFSTSYDSIYPRHEITKHGEAVPTNENYNLFDLNGNIAERYNAVQQISDFPAHHEQKFEDGHYQTNFGHGDYYMSYYSEDINVSYSMPNSSPSGFSYYSGGYTTQASFDSEDSFEVPDQELHNNIQGTTQIAHTFRNTQHNSPCEARCALPNFRVFAECKKVANRRGRPVTYNKPGYHYSDSDSIHSDDDERTTQSKGCRRGAKNILLWKFLLGELRKPNSNHIKWENESEGIFKFVDTAECSRLWGQMKKKEDMNFEKLSRGIRHYYKDGLMSRRDGIRLVYKFNWERVPRAFWPRVR